jgi:hypothetical protein
MGAQSAQVQSTQSSQPAGKGAGDSPSSERKTLSLSGLSGQPGLGQPNTNGNTGLAPVNSGLDPQAISANPQGFQDFTLGAKQQELQHPGSTYLSQGSPSGKGGQAGQPQTASSFVSGQDGATNANPYPNTVGQISNQSMKNPAGKGKGA